MSDLIAIVYPSEFKAEEVRQRLLKLQKEYLITLSDAVIAVKTDSGDIKLTHAPFQLAGQARADARRIQGLPARHQAVAAIAHRVQRRTQIF